MLGFSFVASTVIYSFVYLDLVFYVLIVSVFIPVWVFGMLGWQVLSSPNICLLDNEDNFVELAWTVVPTFLVLILCFLNLQCLGSDFYRHALNVVKVIGRQWYWEYEIDNSNEVYDSFMTDFVGCVDKPLRLDYLVPQCLLITSADVIHSFSVPTLSLKCDAVPGRVNQITFTPDRLGVFVGYCSELCGAGHAYMPIVVEVVKSTGA